MQFDCLQCYCLLVVLISGSTSTKIVKREAEVRQDISTSEYDGSNQKQISYNSNSPLPEPPQADTAYTLPSQNYFQPSPQFEHPPSYNQDATEIGNQGNNQWTTSVGFDNNHYTPYQETQNLNTQTEAPLQPNVGYGKDALQNNQFYPSDFYKPIDLTQFSNSQNFFQNSNYGLPQNSFDLNQFSTQTNFDSSFKGVVPSVSDFSNIKTIDLTNIQGLQNSPTPTENFHTNEFSNNNGLNYPTYTSKPNSELTPQADLTIKNNENFKYQTQKHPNPIPNNHSDIMHQQLLKMYITPHLIGDEGSKPYGSKIRFGHSPHKKCYGYKYGGFISRCKPMKYYHDKSKFRPGPHMSSYQSHSYPPRYDSDTQSSSSNFNLGSLHYVPDSAERDGNDTQKKRPVRFILKRKMQPASICKKLPNILSTLMCT
ncbi:hypothetical protein FQR65_LT06961 [Abscondita terminalis]|nr:hypothetical protein FQR65_LT06961 [Abscondita terminalis]